MNVLVIIDISPSSSIVRVAQTLKKCSNSPAELAFVVQNVIPLCGCLVHDKFMTQLMVEFQAFATVVDIDD